MTITDPRIIHILHVPGLIVVIDLLIGWSGNAEVTNRRTNLEGTSTTETQVMIRDFRLRVHTRIIESSSVIPEIYLWQQRHNTCNVDHAPKYPELKLRMSMIQQQLVNKASGIFEVIFQLDLDSETEPQIQVEENLVNGVSVTRDLNNM